MKFKDWLKKDEVLIDTYNYPEEALEMAWDAAIEQAEMIVAEKYDEQEPWLEPGEISKRLIDA